MIRKFVGNMTSIEATSSDGRLWEITLYDQGHVTRYVEATEAELLQLAAEKHMRPEGRGAGRG
jgi:hypothetical protein